MRRTCRVPIALALLALAASPTRAQEARPGRYDLAGVSSIESSYGGRAWITRGVSGQRLTLVRQPGLRVVGRLVPGASSTLSFEAPLPSTSGLVGVVVGGEPGAAPVLRARYLRSGDQLVGRWEIVERRGAGEVVVAHGRETLTRRRPASAPKGRVRVAVSVDWEGRDLGRGNLEAMAALRRALPGVPLTHFLNAAYLTKPGADAAWVGSQLRGAVLPGDETGLHVHGWRSLFEDAGVTFRDRPTFWNDGTPLHPAGGDEGHEVEIGAYPVDDLRRVLRRSRELLASIGFPISGSFRAGGWMATPNVLEAIRAEGFDVDSSATDGTWHDELNGLRLQRRIPEVWPEVTARSQPYRIDTPAGPVLEMPDTCALADYVTPDEMVRHIREAVERLQQDPSRDVFVHIGLHQETAHRYGQRVVLAVQALLRDRDLPLVFETLEASARAARASMGQ